MLFFKNKLKEWAENNNLNYQKKDKLGLIRSENVSFEDLIKGEYKGKKLYLFKVSDSTDDLTKKHIFFNGLFYAKIVPEDIDQLLTNKNYLEQTGGTFGFESDTEIIQIIVAHLYLNLDIEMEHEAVKKIYKLLRKFYNSKVSFKDRAIGNLTGNIRSDIKFNSPEAISFVMEKGGNPDMKLVEAVANTYEGLLGNFNNSSAETKLEDINMSKFQ